MVDLTVDVGEGGAPSLESQQNQAIASIKFRQSSMLETIGICLITSHAKRRFAIHRIGFFSFSGGVPHRCFRQRCTRARSNISLDRKAGHLWFLLWLTGNPKTRNMSWTTSRQQGDFNDFILLRSLAQTLN